MVVLGFLSAGPQLAQAELARIEGSTMGTYYSVAVDSETSVDTAELQSRIEDCLLVVNQQMSTWMKDSEISRFNQFGESEWFEVSADFALVVAEAKRIHELTGGAFDPTVAPLIDIWGFGDQRPRTVPAQSAIDDALVSVGMDNIHVQHDPPALRKLRPEIQLNLSAIAKGFGVDQVSKLLDSLGYPAHVVDIGGEDRTGVRKLNGDKWRLGVESPLGGVHQVLPLEQTSIATSGDYRNFFVVEGRKFSHALNPVTGWPVENPPASVSVVHPSCMTADAWATAMMVLGADKGMAIAAEQNLDVMFMYVDSGKLTVSARGLFSQEPTEEATGQTTTESSDSPASLLTMIGIAAAVFSLAMLGMAIGVIVRNKSLKGSCGGIAAFENNSDSPCMLCTKPIEQCRNPELREQAQNAAAGDKNGDA
ncbi:MAG: FAD:protein FMN transferase [Planctomycetaceae bacterium]|nr:FAD:protein FMN transferase [Planctomycetaceae bacterium]